MAIKVVSSSTLVGKGGKKVAVHSAAGMGKTMLAATAPKPLVIMTERTGVDALSEANIRKVFGDKKGITFDIPIIEAYTVADIEAAITYARDSSKHETVIFDSVSELSKLKLREEKPLHKNKLQAYGAMADQIDDMLREMRDDPKNWIWLFHSSREDVYGEDGEPSSTQMVPGFEGRRMGHEFPHLVGDVYCMVSDFGDDGVEKRMLRTRTGDTCYYAKNRRGLLDELEEPHLGRIFWKLSKK